MRLYRKQKQTHRHSKKLMVTERERGWGREKLGTWDEQIQTTVQKTDKQQGFTVYHRELYAISLISCSNLQWIIIWKKYIIASLCCTPETNVVNQLCFAQTLLGISKSTCLHQTGHIISYALSADQPTSHPARVLFITDSSAPGWRIGTKWVRGHFICWKNKWAWCWKLGQWVTAPKRHTARISWSSVLRWIWKTPRQKTHTWWVDRCEWKWLRKWSQG